MAPIKGSKRPHNLETRIEVILAEKVDRFPAISVWNVNHTTLYGVILENHQGYVAYKVKGKKWSVPVPLAYRWALELWLAANDDKDFSWTAPYIAKLKPRNEVTNET